jgi:superfamily I DNA/RNA helicase
VAYAADILRNPTVARLIAASYPLIVIDEFQDCIGEKLNLVSALAAAAQLILAADAFQLLDCAVSGCPAVEWVESLTQSGLKEHHNLTEPWRFTNRKIFSAASALRDSRRDQSRAVTVYYGPALPAAWRIMERLFLGWYGSPRWTGSTALISPSSGGVIDDVVRLLAEQTTKKGYKPIRWTRHAASEDEQASLFEALGVSSDHLDESDWQPGTDANNLHAAEVSNRAKRFAHLRGLKKIPKHLISSLAEQLVHTSRAHSRKSSRFIVTTIHGAKNCQFDNVCVLWSYQIPPDRELQRRLLYNAITRAKMNCIVFDTRRKDIATNDPIVTLLGSPEPTFKPKPKKKAASRGAKKRGR